MWIKLAKKFNVIFCIKKTQNIIKKVYFHNPKLNLIFSRII